MFVGLDHVGVAVKNLDEAVKVYHGILGFELKGIHILKERKVKVAFFSMGAEGQIELLEPLGSDSPVAKFLEARGEGIHHIAIRVDDIEKKLIDLKQRGAVLIDDKPRDGAEQKKIAFVSPKSAKGVLVELVELPK